MDSQGSGFRGAACYMQVGLSDLGRIARCWEYPSIFASGPVGSSDGFGSSTVYGGS